MAQYSKQSVKVFSAKIVFFTNLQSFLPRKFSAIWYAWSVRGLGIGYSANWPTKQLHLL